MHGETIDTGELFPVGDVVRHARRVADLSQRELARRVGLAPSTVSRIEAGTIAPTLPVFQRLISVAGLRLAVLDRDGQLVTPAQDDQRDAAGRRYPAHLDLIPNPRPEQWWGDVFDLPAPAVTFRRDRARRDAERAGADPVDPVRRERDARWPVGFRRRRRRPR